MELARRHLGPPRRGLEIGASAINPFAGVDAWNVDHPGGELFQTAQQRAAGGALPIDVLALGDQLGVRSGSVDFVLASHVLEHMPDTIAALGEWSRVVADGGIVFLVVPHKERTFDRDRPRTPLEHHLADHALGMTIDRSPMLPTSHYHVWVTEDLVRLIEHLVEVGFLDWELLDVEDVDSKVGNGFTIVARKRSQPPLVAEPPPAGIAFHFLTLELPFQVPGRDVELVVPGERLVPPDDLPRGRYRAVPISDGFPPAAGRPRLVEVGAPLPPPVVERVARDGPVLVLHGRHLSETTYLQVELPGGRTEHLLPVLDDGALRLDTTGLVVPDAPVRVRAVNLPPGGGAGPAFELDVRRV